MKTVLNVPFGEKEKAKSLGARWDPARKYWYCPDGVDLALFARWLPKKLEGWLGQKKQKRSRRKRKSFVPNALDDCARQHLKSIMREPA